MSASGSAFGLGTAFRAGVASAVCPALPPPGPPGVSSLAAVRLSNVAGFRNTSGNTVSGGIPGGDWLYFIAGNRTLFTRTNLRTGAVESLPNLPSVPLAVSALVGSGGRIYAGFGDTNDSFDQLHYYDEAAGTWHEAAPAPTARTFPAWVGLPEGGVLRIGGGSFNSVSAQYQTASIDRYFAASNTWQTLPIALPVAGGQQWRAVHLGGTRVLIATSIYTPDNSSINSTTPRLLLLDYSAGTCQDIGSYVAGSAGPPTLLASLPGGRAALLPYSSAIGGGTLTLIDPARPQAEWQQITLDLGVALSGSAAATCPHGVGLLAGGFAPLQASSPLGVGLRVLYLGDL